MTCETVPILHLNWHLCLLGALLNLFLVWQRRGPQDYVCLRLLRLKDLESPNPISDYISKIGFLVWQRRGQQDNVCLRLLRLKDLECPNPISDYVSKIGFLVWQRRGPQDNVCTRLLRTPEGFKDIESPNPISEYVSKLLQLHAALFSIADWRSFFVKRRTLPWSFVHPQRSFQATAPSQDCVISRSVSLFSILPVNLAWEWRQSVFYHKMGFFCIYNQQKLISILCYGEFMESAILHNIRCLSVSVVYKCRAEGSHLMI